jgi:acylglycerol lipase
MPETADVVAPILPELSSLPGLRSFPEKTSSSQGFVTSADGTRLFYHSWPAEDWNGRVAVVLHGIGYHSGPYRVIADTLNPHGTDVYALDARGHGMSQAPRGFVGTTAQVVEDVASMIELVRQQRPSAKIFLIGDSMGADFALAYARENSPRLAGLVLLALALNLHWSQFLSLESLRLMPYLLLAHRKPVINLVGQRLEESSRDQRFIAERRVDPLAYKNVSFGYLLDVQRLVFGWRWKIAPRIQSPTLLIEGGKDRVVSHFECEAFARCCAAQDKQFKIFPDVPHTTLWDPQTPEILGLVGRWVLEH